MQFLRPYRNAVDGGLMSYERLPLDQAEQMVSDANFERFQRRKLKEIPEISPAEVDLVAGLLAIGATGFTLQHPVGPYDADIYFEPERLMIEVDGRDFHDAAKDWRRDAYAREEFCIKTVRFRAATVWQDPVAAAKIVAAHVGRRRLEIREGEVL